MNQPHFENFSVKIVPPATAFYPLNDRKYTVTHSESTGAWFLSIGTDYEIPSMKNSDQNVVKAEWITKMGEYILRGKIIINSEEYDNKLAQVRYMIYQMELPKLISVMIAGDKQFFHYHPLLLDAPIHIQFESNILNFHKSLFMGTPRQYLLKESVQT